MTEEIKQSYLLEFEKYKGDVIEQINMYSENCEREYLITFYGDKTLNEFHYNIKTKIGYLVIDGVKIKALEYKNIGNDRHSANPQIQRNP